MARRRIAFLTAAALATAVLAALAPSAAAGGVPIAPFRPQPSRPTGSRSAALHSAAYRALTLRQAEAQRSTLRSPSFRRDLAQHRDSASSSGPMVSGTVTDTAGNPLSGVQIYSSRGYAESSFDGTYRLHVSRGRHRVSFDGTSATTVIDGGTGYVGVTRTFQVGTKSVHAAPVVLPTGAAVAGRVVDEQGHPLGYATMSVLPIAQNTPYVDAADDEGFYPSSVNFGVVQSRASGRYTITGAGAGAALVCFVAQELGGVPTGGSAGDFGYQSVCSNRPVTLVPGRTVNIGRLVLPIARDGELAGRVVRPDGRPIPYVDVLLFGNDSPYLQSDAFAGQDGTFHSPALPAGRYQLCPFLFDDTNGPVGGLYTPCVPSQRVTAGQVTHVVLHAQRGAAVRGWLRSRSGTPLSGVDAVFQRQGAISYEAGVTSNRHGHFAIDGLPAGRYAVCFTGAGFFGPMTGATDPTGVLSTCSTPQHVTLRAGRLTSGIRARLRLAGAISGQVTDPAGRPFRHPQGIQVSVGEAQVSVDSTGRFSVPNLRSATYKVCATSYVPAVVGRSCAPTRVQAVAGRIVGGIHLVLTHADRVVVHTTDAAGNPLAGVDATLIAPCQASPNVDETCSTQPLFNSSQQVEITAAADTDSAGIVTLYAPKAGSYAVCTYGYWATSATGNVATGYGDACHDTTFATAVGSKPVTVDQVIAAAGAVTGQVTDADGHPIAGARVEITNSGATDYQPTPNESDDDGFGYPTVPTPKAEARTDANGDYTIYSVAAGDQQVCATTPRSAGEQHGCLANPVKVTAGSTASAPGLSISS